MGRARVRGIVAVFASLVLVLSGAVPAGAAETSAVISGQVIGAPIEGESAPTELGTNAWVTLFVWRAPAWNPSGPEQWDYADSQSTSADGRYEFAGLAPARYTLMFGSSGAAGRYVDEYWNDATMRDEAEAIDLAAGSQVVADAQLTRAATITGSVAGQQTGGVELENVSVTAFPLDGGQLQSGYQASFRGEPGYRIEGLAPGRYQLRFAPQDGGHAGEWWNDSWRRSGATTITLTAGQVLDGVDATLASGASLEGSVRWSGGTPAIVGIRVYDVADAEFLWDRTWESRADGTFSIDQLAPGEYKLEFVSFEGEADQVVGYADGATSLADAPTVVVDTVGQVVTGTDVTLGGSGPAVSASTPTIVGSLATGETVTVKLGVWSPGTVFKYQWRSNGVAISGATKATYTVAGSVAEKTLSVVVTGTKAGHTPATRTATGTLKVARAATPSITGSAKVGSVLTAKTGTWTSKTSFAYQWYADAKAIAGATKSTYSLTASSAGKRVTVRVTGKKAGFGTAAKTSATTAVVAGGVLVARTPTISGSLGTGAVVTAKPGTWTSSTTFSYQWFADGVAISGATKATLTIPSSAAAKRLTVRVTGKKAGFTTASRTSSPTTRVAATAVPTISGTVRVGSTVTAKPGKWTTGTTFKYQWYANAAAISGATAATFKVPSSVAGKKLAVKVTGTRSGYATVARTSTTAVVSALFTATPTPTITGSTNVGSMLQARPGTWLPAPVTLTYSWERDGVAIAGADEQTYFLTQEDAGAQVTVTVTGSMAGAVPVSRRSAAVKAVNPLDPQYVRTAITTDTTWTRETTPLVVIAPQWGGGVEVAEGVTLTIGAGVVVKYANDTYLDVAGALLVEGTAGSPTIMTSIADDTIGGDTNSDGNASSPDGTPQWSRYVVTGTGNFDIAHAHLRHSRGIDVSSTASGVERSIRVVDSEVTGGIVVTRTSGGATLGSAEISRNTVVGETGIQAISRVGWLDRDSAAAPVTIADNHVSQSSGAGIVIVDGRLRPSLITGNVLDGNQIDAIEISGNLVENWTTSWGTVVVGDAAWRDSSWPGNIVLERGLIVDEGVTLTLSPGTIMKFPAESPDEPGLAIYGTVDARGTAEHPVILTSILDDSAGGDTNGDGGATLPAAGDWLGIRTWEATLTMSHASIRYAESGVDRNGNGRYLLLKLDDVQFAHHTNACLSTPQSAAGSYFRGSVSDCPIGVDSEYYAFDARYVDWGSADGPPPYGDGPRAEGGQLSIFPWVGAEVPAPEEPAPQVAAPDACRPILFMGVRGSGESPSGGNATSWSSYTYDEDWAPGQAFSGMGSPVQGVLDGSSPSQGTAAGDSFIQTLAEEGVPRDEVEVRALVYRAAPTDLLTSAVSVDLNPFGGLPLPPAAVPYLHVDAAKIASYMASIETGVAALTGVLSQVRSECPEQRIVLAGYSQGALVIHQALNDLARTGAPVVDRIASVVLIADPAQRAQSNRTKMGSSTFGSRGLWQWLPGTDKTDLPQQVRGVIAYCNDLDIVCAMEPASFASDRYGERVHTSYMALEMRELGRLAAYNAADALPE